MKKAEREERRGGMKKAGGGGGGYLPSRASHCSRLTGPGMRTISRWKPLGRSGRVHSGRSDGLPSLDDFLILISSVRLWMAALPTVAGTVSGVCTHILSLEQSLEYVFHCNYRWNTRWSMYTTLTIAGTPSGICTPT